MNYGTKLYELRKKQSLSQEEVANKLGVTRQSISLWETDQAAPSLENLIAIAKLYSISLDALVGLNDLDNKESLIEDKPVHALDYLEDKHVVYTRDYMYLNAKADVIMFIISLLLMGFALSLFLSAPNMEIEIARILLIIGNISLMIGIIFYPFYVFICVLKKTEEKRMIHIEFHQTFLIYDIQGYKRKKISYEMIDYYIERKTFFVIFLFNKTRLYLPRQNEHGIDSFLLTRLERRKHKKPIWK